MRQQALHSPLCDASACLAGITRIANPPPLLSLSPPFPNSKSHTPSCGRGSSQPDTQTHAALEQLQQDYVLQVFARAGARMRCAGGCSFDCCILFRHCPPLAMVLLAPGNVAASPTLIGTAISCADRRESAFGSSEPWRLCALPLAPRHSNAISIKHSIWPRCFIGISGQDASCVVCRRTGMTICLLSHAAREVLRQALGLPRAA